MDLFQNPARRIFDKISGINPSSVKEYEISVRNIAKDMAGIYGMTGLKYRVSVSNGTDLSGLVEKELVLFGKEESSGLSAEFPYHFERGGSVVFTAFFENERELDEDIRWTLDALFRQFYYILHSLIFKLSIRRVEVTDLKTRIPNLEGFIRFGSHLIGCGKLGEYTGLYFNIHNFKSVHKSLSYFEGDKVLAEYCRIVSQAVTDREMVARISGDNFTALILDENRDYFFDLIRNMVVNYHKDGKDFTFLFGATIGAAKLTDEKNAGEIMMHISAAYQTARENRTPICNYDREKSYEIIERKIILSKFVKALNEREFFVMYQPKVGVKDRTLLGAEALVRWRHGDVYVMPSDFIPVLENDGCITALDFYVLEEVCKLLRRLSDEEGVDPVKISVNFSKRHLSNNKLVEEIVEVIDRYEIPHKYIEVELTESEDYHNHGVMKDIVDDLNLMGIKTSIDDFGTGYSSLGMLRTLQLDELKIDRTFIPESKNSSDQKGMLMLEGVINLAKSLGLTIVVEGVETPDQLELIESMECDIVQGYIFDKPLSESEFIKRIKQKVYVLDREQEGSQK